MAGGSALGCEHREVTSTLERSSAGSASRGRRVGTARLDLVATLPVAALTAALWAVAVGTVVIGGLVTVAWAVGTRGDDSVSTALQASGVVWLLAHHAPVVTANATVTLLPLGLVALPLVLLFRAGRWAARITGTTAFPDAALLVIASTAAYSALGLLIAQLSSISGAGVPDLEALGWTALVAAIGLSAGVSSGASLRTRLLGRVPAALTRVGIGVVAGGAALVALVALVAAAAVLARWSTVTGLSHQAAQGPWDALGLFLLSLAYLPNMLIWTLSYVAGPGFAAGGGSTIDPFTTSGALLPGIPILGAVPSSPPAFAPLLLLIPILAGVVSAVIVRRRVESASVAQQVWSHLGSAIVVGLATAWLCALSGGALGAARLADLGPHVKAVGLAVTVLIAVGSLATTALIHFRPTSQIPDRSSG